MGNAYAVNAVITRDDGRTVDYRPRCPYCGHVPQMMKMVGAHASFGGTHSHSVCQSCGKTFEIILRRE